MKLNIKPVLSVIEKLQCGLYSCGNFFKKYRMKELPNKKAQDKSDADMKMDTKIFLQAFKTQCYQ